MQKALVQMNIQITEVLSDVTGPTRKKTPEHDFQVPAATEKSARPMASGAGLLPCFFENAWPACGIGMLSSYQDS